MTVAVLQFGGSNCDRDAVRALEHVGVDAERAWYEDGLGAAPAGVLIPGGFSYGDYLRAGAMAARAPVMATVAERASEGLPVLGVCNGAQIATEAGLVPGAFTVNASARFQCEHVRLRVERADTPWTRAYDEGEVIALPIAHGEGRFECDDATLDRLRDEDRVLFRYCDADGQATDAANPNGSKDNVAGLLGERETTAVLMPHPERATLPDVGGTDGQGVLRGFATGGA
jgi:phosphoribosylformylglycinamidine synthase